MSASPPDGRRVVVTGMGAVTPIGNDVPTFWSNLVAGESGVRAIQSFDPARVCSRIAGEVEGFDPSVVGSSVELEMTHSLVSGDT